MKKDENKKNRSKTTPNLERFKFEVAQELGLSHRKKKQKRESKY